MKRIVSTLAVLFALCSVNAATATLKMPDDAGMSTGTGYTVYGQGSATCLYYKLNFTHSAYTLGLVSYISSGSTRPSTTGFPHYSYALVKFNPEADNPYDPNHQLMDHPLGIYVFAGTSSYYHHSIDEGATWAMYEIYWDDQNPGSFSFSLLACGYNEQPVKLDCDPTWGYVYPLFD